MTQLATNLLVSEELDREIEYIGRQVAPGTTLKIPGMLARAEWDAFQAWKNSQWFLIRNDGATTNELWACRRHKLDSPHANAATVMAKPVHHPYFTVACVNAPFPGLDRALMKYVAVRSKQGDPRGDKQRKALAPYIPDLADSQPGMAAKLAVPKGDAYYAIAVALTEPITPQEAQRYIDEIAYVTGQPAHLKAV